MTKPTDLYLPEDLAKKVFEDANQAEKMNFPEQPPAPNGWAKIFPDSDVPVVYIRKSAIHMIMCVPDSALVVTAEGVEKPGVRYMVSGMVGDRPVNQVVDMKIEDLLAIIAEN